MIMGAMSSQASGSVSLILNWFLAGTDAMMKVCCARDHGSGWGCRVGLGDLKVMCLFGGSLDAGSVPRTRVMTSAP